MWSGFIIFMIFVVTFSILWAYDYNKKSRISLIETIKARGAERYKETQDFIEILSKENADLYKENNELLFKLDNLERSEKNLTSFINNLVECTNGHEKTIFHYDGHDRGMKHVIVVNCPVCSERRNTMKQLVISINRLDYVRELTPKTNTKMLAELGISSAKLQAEYDRLYELVFPTEIDKVFSLEFKTWEFSNVAA